jgi:hypothetical protein
MSNAKSPFVGKKGSEKSATQDRKEKEKKA